MKLPRNLCFSIGILAAASTAIVACDSAPSEVREWSPGDHDQAPSTLGTTNPRAPTSARPGAQIDLVQLAWEKNCTSCHGADGKTGSENRNVASYAAANKNDTIEQIIEGEGTMPAYGAQFSDQEIADLVAYTASLN